MPSRTRVTFQPGRELYEQLDKLRKTRNVSLSELVCNLLGERLGDDFEADLERISLNVGRTLEALATVEEGLDGQELVGAQRHRQVLGYLGVLQQMQTETLLLIRLFVADHKPALYESLKPELLKKEQSQRRQLATDMRAAGLDPGPATSSTDVRSPPSAGEHA